jgi:hypothetical protein
MKKRILTIAMAVALLAVTILPVTVMAEDAVVSGTVGTYFTLTVPSTITLPTLNYSTTNPSTAQTISAQTNDATKNVATVTVSGSDSGKLTYSGTSLSSALSLGGTGFTTVALTGSTQSLVGTSDGALSTVGVEKKWTKTTLVITQPAFTAVPAGTYTCTLTFAATFT